MGYQMGNKWYHIGVGSSQGGIEVDGCRSTFFHGSFNWMYIHVVGL